MNDLGHPPKKPHLDHYYSSAQMWNRQCSTSVAVWIHEWWDTSPVVAVFNVTIHHRWVIKSMGVIQPGGQPTRSEPPDDWRPSPVPFLSQTKAPSCIAILSTLGICILFVWWMGLCSLEYRHYRYILFSFLGQSQGRYPSTHFTACTLSVCLWPIARVEYRLMMFLRFMAPQYSNIPPSSSRTADSNQH